MNDQLNWCLILKVLFLTIIFQIDQLKKIIKNMESNSQDIMNKYEHEIHSLNDEVRQK